MVSMDDIRAGDDVAENQPALAAAGMAANARPQVAPTQVARRTFASRMDRLEEAANALTHGIAAGLSVAALVVMVVAAAEAGSGIAIVAASIFGTALIVCYLSSSIAHSARRESVHRFFDFFDHCSIYVLIAGTNTPFALLALPPDVGWPLFGIIWALAIAGITFKVVAFAGDDPKRFDLLSTILYVAMGWFGFLYSAWLLVDVLHPAGFMFLLLGGLFYTGGTIFYQWRLMPFSHAVWHLCALAGSVMHFFCIFLYVIPNPA